MAILADNTVPPPTHRAAAPPPPEPSAYGMTLSRRARVAVTLTLTSYPLLAFLDWAASTRWARTTSVGVVALVGLGIVVAMVCFGAAIYGLSVAADLSAARPNGDTGD